MEVDKKNRGGDGIVEKPKKVVNRIHLKHREDNFTPPIKFKVSSACTGPKPINTSEISIIPTVFRYFYILNANLNLTNGATIPSNLFFNDNGNLITEFTTFTPNGYVNLYVNGMIQESGIYHVNSNSLTFIPQPATIFRGTPITIESLGFSAQVN